ncbi:MFS transporter [Ilumatobacter sp.]|uniref:MFS transporter n=3 Tax=Ilumatobacter sp. TaxID=1967498 RepID=UPI0032989FE1
MTTVPKFQEVTMEGDTSQSASRESHAAVIVAVGADDGYARRLLVTVIGGLIVFSSSMTIVSASLPTMADDLDSTESFLSWSVTGLFLMMAVGTPVLGRLGDSHGHRKVFLRGSLVLAVGTMLCGLAPTAEAFVGARMLVGLGIAATMPNAMALIMEAYPASRRSEAMGWFQMAMTGAPVIGLIVGGPLIDLFGWRIVFAILTPVSLIGFAAAWRVIRPSAGRDRVQIDWAGAAGLGIATLGFLLFLERGSSAGFADPLAALLALLAVGSIAVFVRIERRAPKPMLRLDYFRRSNFTGPLIAQPLSQFAYMGAFLIAPLLLDDLFGYSVGAISLVLLARPLVYSVSSPVGGRLATTIGERQMIIAGSVLMVLSMLTWVLAAHWVNLALIILGLVLSGLAMGLASPSYATTIAAAVDDGDLGIANAMGTTMMNIGMLTGIQTMFVVLGDGRGPDDFAMVFGFGAVVTAFGLIGGFMVDARPQVAGPEH